MHKLNHKAFKAGLLATTATTPPSDLAILLRIPVEVKAPTKG